MREGAPVRASESPPRTRAAAERPAAAPAVPATTGIRAWQASRSFRRRADGSGRLAKSDRSKPVVRAAAAQDHLVAVFEEGARFARGQRDRIPAALRDFKQRAQR